MQDRIKNLSPIVSFEGIGQDAVLSCTHVYHPSHVQPVVFGIEDLPPSHCENWVCHPTCPSKGLGSGDPVTLWGFGASYPG